MLLSMSLIAARLQKYNPEIHIVEDKKSIKGMRFFTDQQPSYSLDYVYLGLAKGYFQDPRYADALLLASGNNQILCHGVEYEELLNAVLAAFEYYSSLEQCLLYISREHGSLDEITDLVKTFSDDPFLVFDLQGNILASAHADRIEDEIFLSNYKNMKNLGSNIISRIFVDEAGNISHDLTGYPQHLHEKGTNEEGVVAMYLIQSGERIGFVLWFPKNPFRTSVCMCLEELIAETCAASREFTEQNSLIQGRHSIFLRLLQQESLNDAVLHSFRERMNFNSPPVLMVFNSISIQNYTFRHMLMQEIDQPEVQGISCEFENHVVILTSMDALPEIQRLIFQRIPAENAVIGISMPFQKPEGLYTAYRQALFALARGEGPGIRACKDVALDYLLECLRENNLANTLLHPAVAALQDYDETNSSSLLETLQVYLECGLSQTLTAKKLFVHLNTLKYRIRRISEIGNIDFDNSSEVFYLQLSMAMKH